MMALALPFAYLHARAAGISLKVFGGIMLGISFVLLNKCQATRDAAQLGRPGWPRRRPAWCTWRVAGRFHLAGSLSMNANCLTRACLLLFAHGSRDESWAAPFARAAARVRGGRTGGWHWLSWN